MTRLVAVGDLVLGDTASAVGFGFNSIYQQKGLDAALGGVVSALRSGDIVFGNLEAVLSDRDRDPHRPSSLHMRGTPRFAAALRGAGFTVLNVANNHANQHGDAAFADTCQCLAAAGIAICGLPGTNGWTSTPVLAETATGEQVGLLGYCLHPRQYFPDRAPPFAEGDAATILADVRRLRQQCRTLVVSVHWGTEFTSQPSVSQVRLANDLLAAGACLVLGHHSHVVQPIVESPGGTVAYSLGNFVSDMLWEESLRRGVILTCDVADGLVRNITIADTTLDASGAPVVSGRRNAAPAADVPGVPEETQQALAGAALRRMRRAKAAYLLSNLSRRGPRFALQQLARVIRNRLPRLG